MISTDDELTVARFHALRRRHILTPNWADVLQRRDALQPSAAVRPRRRRPTARTTAGFAIAVAAVGAFVLLIPWSRPSSLNDQALAAIGSQPVLHVIATFDTDVQSVSLATSRVQPLSETEELWFDESRSMLRTVSTRGSHVIDEVLETPAGSYTPQGIVYDCTWIAAHPQAATKAHVSCNASGDNGQTPHIVPRPAPTVQPGLADFADNYRAALASGSAKDDGSGTVNGQRVDWIVFQTDSGRERVALDHSTHKPVLLEDRAGPALHINTIETIAYDSADFTEPGREQPRPSLGVASDVETLGTDATAISARFPGALWAGETVDRLVLVRVEKQALHAEFSGASSLATKSETGLELDYGKLSETGHIDRSGDYLEISVAPSSTLAAAYMWPQDGTEPAAGTVSVKTTPAATAYGIGGKPVAEPSFTIAYMVIDGRYVTIRSSTPELAIAAAKAIAPVRP